MKSVVRLTSGTAFPVIVALLTGSLLVSPTKARAQCTGVQGQNGVSAYCGQNSTLGTVGSVAFIDASVFLGQTGKGSDVCDVIYKILNGTDYNYPASGAVIDARGIASALTCTLGSPWSEASGYLNKPSTILLPAGTIVIPSTWLLPDNTKLIGEGPNATGGTTIQAKANSFTTNTAMIQFGGAPASRHQLGNSGRALVRPSWRRPTLHRRFGS